MQLTETSRQLVSAVSLSVGGGDTQSEELVKLLASNMRMAFAASGRAISDDEFEEVIKELHYRLAISMDIGTALVEHDHVPWLSARKADIDPFYWRRFHDYLLREGWPSPVAGALDSVTDEVLDLLGDPAQGGKWNRRGLVIGDVQSGKTATYTSLCCKAADAGYRVIILLTGTLESLRRQTQKRLDEGFVGLDSSDILSRETGHSSRVVGAGELDRRRFAGVFTSRTRDFNRDLLNSLGFTLRTFSEPVLVVIKKNKRVLENLENWLRGYNADRNTGLIDEPMLLIDDEADNASVNTAAIGADPTSINERIRALLKLFAKSSYIGFTATPFANIFIDPTNDSEMLGHDLFPRDFIYTLEPPTNYVGATRIFGDESDNKLICHINDAEESFPAAHKSSFQVTSLPDSLIRSVGQFFLANAVRDLRGDTASHRSMLVNVSRFTAVQSQLARMLDHLVRDMQQDIRSYSRLDPDESLRNSTLAKLKEIWDEDFPDIEFEWEDVRNVLLTAVLPITVRAVNQQTGASSLDYSRHAATGLRIIAVGGLSLSRGLTLEGLCTSYFYRNSQMYDTLLQMGRWFGYRDGYVDLCRLWLTETAQEWYSHITLSSEELRDEVQRMKRLSLTPKEFGLKVRSHPDSLIVTARNKMRLANTIEQYISFSAEGVETTRLKSNKKAISANARAVRSFVGRLEDDGFHHTLSEWDNIIWRKVPKKYVADLLDSFDTHPHNFSFYTPEDERQSQGLIKFIRETDIDDLQTWDIVLPKGGEEEIDFAGSGIRLKPLRRFITLRDDNTIMVSGTKARVGSRGVEREGIPQEKAEKAKDEYLEQNPDKKSAPDKIYREIRPRPLLLIYAVVPYLDDKNVSTTISPNGDPLVALGLSFPRFDDSAIAKKVLYKVNLIEWQNAFEAEADDDQGEENGLD